MKESELDELLWHAFSLGAHVVENENEMTPMGLFALGEAVRQIAQGEMTVRNPTALPSANTGLRGAVMDLDNETIRADRDLAKRIFRGFVIHTGDGESS